MYKFFFNGVHLPQFFLLISLWIHNFEDMTGDGFNLGVGMWDITDFYCISRTWTRTTRQAQGGREELKLGKECKSIKLLVLNVYYVSHQNARKGCLAAV